MIPILLYILFRNCKKIRKKLTSEINTTTTTVLTLKVFSENHSLLCLKPKMVGFLLCPMERTWETLDLGKYFGQRKGNSSPWQLLAKGASLYLPRGHFFNHRPGKIQWLFDRSYALGNRYDSFLPNFLSLSHFLAFPTKVSNGASDL